MRLTADIRHRLGMFDVDARFDAGDGITALFGRSGSGKTSIVNVVAGLLRPDEGRILLDGESIVDTTKRHALPPYSRRFGYVFQDARLFPHLSVRSNLTYGRWLRKAPDDASSFERIVDLLGMEPLLGRTPARLSGGEKQRVAIGRALLSRPRLLLMDEPLAALDEARKAEILPYLERLRDETTIPVLYVSHSVAEVSRLADRVLLVENGRIAGSGSAADMLSLPSGSDAISRREAGTVIEGIVESEQPDARITHIRSGAVRLRIPGRNLRPDSSLRLRIAARDVMIATIRPQGLSALNVIEGTILAIAETARDQVDVTLDCSGTRLAARITAISRDALDLRAGLRVHAVIKTVALDP